MANNDSTGTLTINRNAAWVSGAGLIIGNSTVGASTVRMSFDLGNAANSADTIVLSDVTTALNNTVNVGVSGATVFVLPQSGVAGLTAGMHDLITF